MAYREKAIREYGERCQICESVNEIVVHHIDGNRENDNIGNLLVVCRTCHGKIHSPEKMGEPYDGYTVKLPVESVYGVSFGEGGLARTGISIRKDQKEWLANNPINLSEFVRKRLDILIENNGSI